jgi:hypothetical protein
MGSLHFILSYWDLSLCWPMSSFFFNFILLFTIKTDLRLMGVSPDEDLTSYVHVAHGLEVSSQTNIIIRLSYMGSSAQGFCKIEAL